MLISRLLTATAALSLIAGAAMAQAPAPATAPAPAATTGGKLVPTGDLITTLKLNADFSNFVKALDLTNLSALLKSSPGLTVFAPTNAAFTQAKLDSLSGDKTALQKMLLHYIINAKVDSSKIKGSHGPVPSGAGDQIVLDGTGPVLKADNANITQPDVMTSNGVIHVVDALMVAGSVPAALPPPPAEATAAAPEPAPAAKPPVRKKK